jgi:hypothetical protein
MEASTMSLSKTGLSGTDQISVKEAYVALYRFVDAYWERGGRHDGSVTLLRHGLGPSLDPGDESVVQTTDPASWDDWLTAVVAARNEGLPDEL